MNRGEGSQREWANKTMEVTGNERRERQGDLIWLTRLALRDRQRERERECEHKREREGQRLRERDKTKR